MYGCRNEAPSRDLIPSGRAEGGGGVSGGGLAGEGRGETLRRRVHCLLVASRRCCALKYVEVDEGVEEGGGEWDARAGWKVGVVSPSPGVFVCVCVRACVRAFVRAGGRACVCF
jgi:hypothetical protein